MRKNITITELLGGFGDDFLDEPKTMKEGRPVTIWMPKEVKIKFDNLQKKSNRRFGKKAREVLIALIDLAEERLPII